eukprot:jgi/Picre1/34231/NNA_001705.t1
MSSSIEPGSLLGKGRYRVVKEINRGGTAVVYEGVDLMQQTRVALKVMSPKHYSSSSSMKAVKREIEYAVSVQNDHVVKLLDFVADERHVVIVWELITGSDLLDLLNDKGGRLQEREAAFYFAQLLQAVMFIHSHGLCHRDLKPENCMVEQATNRLKIIDFGLSRREQSAVTLGVGTPDYMAPELLGATTDNFDALKQRRVGKYDAKACDVWAMGVLLYLLVTGKYPFENPKQSNNVIATLQNIRNGRMRPLPSRISAECVNLIECMLRQDPQQRITLADMCAHPWFRMCNVSSTVTHSADAGDGDALLEKKDDSFSFPSSADDVVGSKNTPATIQSPIISVSAHASSSTTTPPPKVAQVSRNESGDTIIKVTKVSAAEQQKPPRTIGILWIFVPSSLTFMYVLFYCGNIKYSVSRQ